MILDGHIFNKITKTHQEKDTSNTKQILFFLYEGLVEKVQSEFILQLLHVLNFILTKTWLVWLEL